MYMSNNGNKSKQNQRTKLTDMGVVMIDDEETDSTSGIKGKFESEQSNQQEAKKVLLNEGDAPIDITSVDAKEKRGRFKRVLIAGGVAASLLFTIFGIGYFWLSSNRSENDAYKVKTPATNKADEQPQRGIMAEEISEELNKHKTDGNTQSEQTSPNQTENSSSVNSSSPITDRLPNEDLSATVKSSEITNTQTSAATNYPSRSTGGTTSNNIPENGNSVSRVSSENNLSFVPVRSIRVSTLKPENEKENKPENKSQARYESSVIVASSENSTRAKTNTVVLPPFGTLLPVRTVGTIFTLRSASYIRFELTRDMSGEGWKLKRGTQFYGTVKSADVETARAFISVSGFIDPDTNRFVRVSASVMGNDGADGIRGKKHKLNSGWVNALKKVGREVLDTAKSAATGIGRRPIIITENSGGITDPIAEEISGLVLSRNGFVEVGVGTACYLLVETQPAEIQGVDSDVSSFSINQSLNQNRLSEERLSEEEVADLLTKGNRDEIRRALPRMTSEMRRVAEIFLSNK